MMSLTYKSRRDIKGEALGCLVWPELAFEYTKCFGEGRIVHKAGIWEPEVEEVRMAAAAALSMGSHDEFAF
jgi:hypothetical protein